MYSIGLIKLWLTFKNSHGFLREASQNLSFSLRRTTFSSAVGQMRSIKVISAKKSPTFQDLALHGTPVLTDWYGTKIQNFINFLFWIDDAHFHFLASEEGSSGLNHPESEPGLYQAELWKYDVAEFFLRSADGSRYLEFNLAPNGAWWSSAFDAPLEAAPGEPAPIPDVLTSSQQDENGWQAMASFPLDWLQKNFGFGDKTTMNANFILNSPHQIFLSAGDLGSGKPNFHQPGLFPPIERISLA